MLLEQLGAHGHAVLQARFAGPGARCRIGRDLGCDVVVDDEHAAPEHALLTLMEDGRVRVQDLGTRNGTRVGGRRVPGGEIGTVIGEGELLIGKTRLRLRTRHAKLEPERVFRRGIVRRHRSWLATAGVLACIAYGAFVQWLAAPSSLVRSTATAALAVLGLLAVWVGLWALTTKLNQGIWQVRVHVAIASIAAAVCAWGYWLAGLVAFAAQWSVLVKVGVAVVAAATLVALYLHFREATPFSRRMAISVAGAVTGVIAVGAWLVTLGGNDGDVNEVALGPAVRLGSQRVVPNRDIGDYLAEVDALKLAASRERQRSLLNAPLADADD